ncbi:MAG: hypothetical protein J1E57_00750 [Prevotella sp.]|nr:hypothetical protein [Prevotella sp.]
MKKIFTFVTMALVSMGVNAQTWKAGETAPEAGAKIIDNDLVTINTVSETKVVDLKDPVTIDEYTFDYYIQVRTDNPDPSADSPTGGVQTDCTALVVKANKDADVTFYFRRQKGNAGFDTDDNKDMLCYAQNGAKYKYEEEIIPITDDEQYAYAKKTYKFVEGGVYTIYRRGSTINLYGIDVAESAGDEGGDSDSDSDEYTVKADCTGEVKLANITITFLNNTSKGSTADAGTWTFTDGKAIADQNSCEIKFEPTAAGKLIIYFQAKLADNKPVVMFVDGDTENTISCNRVKDDSVIESGANHEELAAGEGIYYMLEAGKTYNFYASGTKYAVKGFSYEKTASGETGISNTIAEKNVNAPAYNLAGQKVDASYKGIVIQNGKKFVQK